MSVCKNAAMKFPHDARVDMKHLRINIVNTGRILQHTFHLKGLNSQGFSYTVGSKCAADKIGRIFHPAGMTNSATILTIPKT